tara:strand:- start:225 stop:788 length:564 start_codon:yes stop_codon:yes gene_type:complete
MAQRRFFLALRPDEDGLDFLTNRIQLFRGSGWERFGRFVPTDDLHLTLRFLGELEDEKMEQLQSGAAEISEQTSPVHYEIGRSVLFPRVSRARIIAAKVTASPELKNLVKLLEQLAQDCGLEPETRLFRPHITLARLKHGQKRPNLPSRPGSISQKATEVLLLESRIGENGTYFYSEVATLPLKSGA